MAGEPGDKSAIVVEPNAAVETGRAPTCDKAIEQSILPEDIRHNMKVNILMDAIFTTGSADMLLVAGPLYVYLKASNTLIGVIWSATVFGLIGVVLSPFITRRFRYKKLLVLLTHVPYLMPLCAIGVALVASRTLGLSNEWLLGFVMAMMVAHWFFAGFVTIPHQEYVAACIPMECRGRFTGYSLTVGGLGAVASSAVGGLILLRLAKPMSFGYLYLMTWTLCQGGYILALFGREHPTPVEKSPKPWSNAMLKAAWDDKRYMRLMLIYLLYAVVFQAALMTFISIYGFRELKMPAATAATLSIIAQVSRIAASTPMGVLVDKLKPKNVLPFWPLVATVAILPILLLRNQWGVYISTAVAALYFIGIWSTFNALVYGMPSPENRAGHYTMQTLLACTGNAIGPVLFGLTCDKLSFLAAFSIVAALGVALFPVARFLASTFSVDPWDYS